MSVEHDIATVEAWPKAGLPADYGRFLQSHEESVVGEQVLLYGLSSLVERNETYETLRYCTGYLAMGDDSGGRAIIIPIAEPLKDVDLVGHGYLDPRGFRLLPRRFSEWLDNGWPVPE